MASVMETERPQPVWPSMQTTTLTDSPAAASQPELITIQQVLAGNDQAFNQLVVAYQGLASSVAYRILRSKDAATDAVQESFFKAYRALATFRGGSFKHWLLRIVVNTCYDLLSRQRRHVVVSLHDLPVPPEYFTSLTDPAERPDAYVERMELRQRIEVGLRALPSEQRTAIVLCEVHGYSYAETAAMMGVAMGTVKSRLARGRSRLAAYFREQELVS